MKTAHALFVALGIGLAGAASAQSDLTVGDTFMWDGTNWVAVNLGAPAVTLPAPVAPAPVVTPRVRPTTVVQAPAPVWTAPQPARVAAPARSRSEGFRPSWLLGVFR